MFTLHFELIVNFRMEVVPSLEELVESGKNLFTSHFGHAPSVASCAPGRVNIIGEHVDYNNGYVLPMAMPLWTVIVGSYSQTKSNKCRLAIIFDPSPASVQL